MTSEQAGWLLASDLRTPTQSGPTRNRGQGVLMAPVYGCVLGGSLDLPVFQKAGMIGIGGMTLAILLSCFFRETGTALIHRKASDGSLVETVLVIWSVN